MLLCLYTENEHLKSQLAQAQREGRLQTEKCERALKEVADARSRLEQAEKTAAER